MPFVRARWRLGEFELDATGELPTLARGGTILPIQPKPLALLAFLIDHRDRILSKDELLAALWPGVAVSEAALTSALRDLPAPRARGRRRAPALHRDPPRAGLPLRPSRRGDPRAGRIRGGTRLRRARRAPRSARAPARRGALGPGAARLPHRRGRDRKDPDRPGAGRARGRKRCRGPPRPLPRRGRRVALLALDPGAARRPRPTPTR